MAITNAQQYQQLVNKPANDKRPGYRGIGGYQEGKSKSTSTKSSSTKSPGHPSNKTTSASTNKATRSPDDRGSPIQNYNTGVATGRIDPNKVAPPPLTDRDKSFYRENPSRKPFQFPSTIKLAQKGINRLMKNQLMRNRIDYFKKLGLYDPEEGIKDLPPELQALADQDLLYTDEALKEIQKMGGTDGIQKFEDFMFEDKGSPHLKFAGNVGGLGTRSAVRDADGNIIGYKFDNVDEFGNIIGTRGEGEGSNLLPPVIAQAPSITEQESEYVNPLSLLSSRIAGTQFAADGGRIGAMGGGIMNTDVMGGLADGGMDESGRQMYFLGKLVKKAKRAVKKITKSPFGKAALLYGLGAMGGSYGSTGKFFSKGMFSPGNIGRGLFGNALQPNNPAYAEGILSKLGLTKGGGSLMPTFKGGITLATALPFLLGGEDDDDKFDIDAYYAANRLNSNAPLNRRILGTEFYAAEGGMPSKEPVAKKTMPLLDMDGQEMDLRAEGGFVPIGRMERADDVPARLSKNEFVFTADAVRNAGEGDIDKGAEVMYNMMKNLESGGEVSEESQGLDGAREMFQTSKRLEEVL
jgi:hypothetical protein